MFRAYDPDKSVAFLPGLRLLSVAVAAWCAAAPTLAGQGQRTIDFPFVPTAFRSGPVDNPLFPLKPGTVYVLKVREGDDVSVDSITVTKDTRMIAGVKSIVVHDRVRRGGKLVEDTFDWYAQDTAGNVWYMGEATREYKFGRVVSRSGSWEAGVHGARPGILMPAHPKVGDSYRQEYRRGAAEDMARVVSVSDTVTVPAGRFSQCITTEDWSPLEPEVVERKTYCPQVGVVRESTIKGGDERSELVTVRRP